jgi:dephospho-CoA kinase
VYEAPLLFEANAQERVDKVLCVTVDPHIQLQRVQKRDGCSRAEAQARIDAQMPQSKKAELSDYVVDNSAGVDVLKKQLIALWHAELAGEKERADY